MLVLKNTHTLTCHRRVRVVCPQRVVCSYAFVEYENEDDMRVAYKRGDGRKIDGRRVLVDVERGRTVRNWLVSPEPIEPIVITYEPTRFSVHSL